MPEPLRLADLDPKSITSDILNVVLARVYRDTWRLGLVVRVAEPGQDEKSALTTAVEGSEGFRAAQALAARHTACDEGTQPRPQGIVHTPRVCR